LIRILILKKIDKIKIKAAIKRARGLKHTNGEEEAGAVDVC
jgi:hypothetical protein